MTPSKQADRHRAEINCATWAASAVEKNHVNSLVTGRASVVAR